MTEPAAGLIGIGFPAVGEYSRIVRWPDLTTTRGTAWALRQSPPRSSAPTRVTPILRTPPFIDRCRHQGDDSTSGRGFMGRRTTTAGTSPRASGPRRWAWRSPGRPRRRRRLRSSSIHTRSTSSTPPCAQGWTPKYTEASMVQIAAADPAVARFMQAVTDYGRCRTKFLDDFFIAAAPRRRTPGGHPGRRARRPRRGGCRGRTAP